MSQFVIQFMKYRPAIDIVTSRFNNLICCSGKIQKIKSRMN